MAPEVLQKAVSYTVDAYLQIDVFAFSLVLWEMVNVCKITEGKPGEDLLHDQ
jgi:hypothetical protein